MVMPESFVLYLKEAEMAEWLSLIYCHISFLQKIFW